MMPKAAGAASRGAPIRNVRLQGLHGDAAVPQIGLSPAPAAAAATVATATSANARHFIVCVFYLDFWPGRSTGHGAGWPTLSDGAPRPIDALCTQVWSGKSVNLRDERSAVAGAWSTASRRCDWCTVQPRGVLVGPDPL